MRTGPIRCETREEKHRGAAAARSSTVGLFITLLAIGCFEDPVTQKVELEFVGSNEIRLTTSVELNHEMAGENRHAMARLRHVEKTLLEGADDWTRRYQSIDSAEESYSWNKRDGMLERIERVAVVDADNLSRFFADTALSVFYTEDLDWAELAIYPGASDRATREQRSDLAERFSAWTDRLEVYYREVDRVYNWVARHPDRTRPVFGAIFRDELSEEEAASLAELSEDESALVERLEETMIAAAGVLVVDERDAYSINEVSELVYDPFPGDLEIRLPGRLMEIEGFDEIDDSTLSVRRVGLWSALESMRERFVSPDPLTVFIGLSDNSSREFDLDSWLSLPKVIHSVPDSDEIRSEVEARLRPQDVYRVRWTR